ncbi:MAG: hypothetical protein JSW39_10595, partial [Desulfobacterales bacterium]
MNMQVGLEAFEHHHFLLDVTGIPISADCSGCGRRSGLAAHSPQLEAIFQGGLASDDILGK